jgi:DNA-binding HxlR family transcriptional regulator
LARLSSSRLTSREMLLDSVVLTILAELYKNKELRYVQLKQKLNISDSALVTRLERLKAHKIVDIVARSNDGRGNYIAYVLTQQGNHIVSTLKVPELLQSLEKIQFA